MRQDKRRGGLEWWAAPLTFLFLSPLGWPLLPVLLFLLVILAGVCVLLFPTLLGIAAIVMIRRKPIAAAKRIVLSILTLASGLTINVLAWHAILIAVHRSLTSSPFQ